MSEQVKRYRFLIDGSHKGVVLAADFDTLAQRCRELEAQLESARQATNSECMDWAREYERRKEAQAERDTLRAEVADQKAALLEAERGNEELVRLRADTRVLRIALDRIAERTEAFVSDDACIRPDSAAAIAMIARNALVAAHDD